jgi:hypothetical protein
MILLWLSWTRLPTILWGNSELHFSDFTWSDETWREGSVFLPSSVCTRLYCFYLFEIRNVCVNAMQFYLTHMYVAWLEAYRRTKAPMNNPLNAIIDKLFQSAYVIHDFSKCEWVWKEFSESNANSQSWKGIERKWFEVFSLTPRSATMVLHFCCA